MEDQFGNLWNIWHHDLLTWTRESAPKLGFPTFSAAPANFADWRSQAKSFEYLAAYTRTQFTLTGMDAAERVPGANVSADYFNLVRTPAMCEWAGCNRLVPPMVCLTLSRSLIGGTSWKTPAPPS